MFRSIGNTWEIMGECWRVLMKDKEILMFPLFSMVCCLLVMASYVVPAYTTGYLELPEETATTMDKVLYYGLMYTFYFVNFFVIVFFNVAIIACASLRMQGGDPTVRYGLQVAMSKIHLIAGWALLAGSVGMILKMIEERSGFIGRIVTSILGCLWALISFLAVPSMVIEHKGPVDAVKRSASLLKDTWGNQIVGNFSFGVIFFLLAIPGIALVVFGIVVGVGVVDEVVGQVGMIASIAVGAIYLLVLMLTSTAMQAIFQAALFLHATEGERPSGFDQSLLNNAIRVK